MTENDHGPESEDDVRLLAELRAAFRRVETPPPYVIATAKAAYGLRDLDAELALLTWDSDVDSPLAAVRGPMDLAGPRALTFEREGLVVEIEIGPAATGRSLVGQLVPPQTARVRVVTAAGESIDLDVDELGRFARDHLPVGPLRLRVERPDAAAVVTAWVRLD
jgi:hypothetical protein